MKVLISFVTGIIVLFPFLVTVSFLIIMRKRGKAPARMMGKAADWTTPFLIISVYFISLSVFGKGSGFVLSGAMIIIALYFATKERLKEKEFQMIRFIHKTWRMYFLLLAIFYLALLFIGISMKVMEYVK